MNQSSETDSIVETIREGFKNAFGFSLEESDDQVRRRLGMRSSGTSRFFNARSRISRFFNARPRISRSFNARTKKQLPVPPGQHRRHIIPFHLLERAISKVNVSPTKRDAMLRVMNNHIPNLKVGAGGVNSALGILTQLRSDQTVKDHRNVFMYNKLATATKNEFLTWFDYPGLKENGRIKEDFFHDIQQTAAFDWPGGEEFQEFRDVFTALKRVSDSSGMKEHDKLAVMIRFMLLTSPSGTHDAAEIVDSSRNSAVGQKRGTEESPSESGENRSSKKQRVFLYRK